ncbi:MAG: VCBS repeat-containing protein [Verrucomicrobia bacterium]|nr:VCBS repeat-containing protein [Verrucomicrobiota bacterium]
MGAIAVETTKATRAPVILRKELTESERNAPLDFSVPLKMRNFGELQERIANQEIISAEEMDAKYYPTAADYQRVVDWLTAEGFEIESQAKGNLSVFAHGSVAQVELAFRTKFARVRFGETETSSALVPPSLPTALAERVLGVNGLQPHLRPKPHSKVVVGQAQKSIDNAPPYTVPEILNAYNATGLGVTGAGQTIGIVIDTFPLASDLLEFWQGNGISQSLSNIEEIQVVPGALPGPSGEESLDVEWSSGIAPGSKVRVYATTDLTFVHLDQAYEAILNDLPDHPELHQVTLSYGIGELYVSSVQMETDTQYFAALAARGVTVFVSSGDGGSSPGPSGDNSGPVQVESPANDPYVTAVGGTSLYLNASNGTIASESAWSDGGGGISTFFGRPAWQVGAGVPSGNHRAVPDVASVADPDTGGYLILDGQLYIVGGTSWSAPVWAAYCAMVNQARANVNEASLGLLGPKIYVLNGTSSFRDITTGSNGPGGVYNAGPFYDLCTGLGVPVVSSLVQALSSIQRFSPNFLSYSGDFNGDGKQDILWRNTQTGEVDIWFMSGASVVSKANVGVLGLDWQIAGIADFNGDGKSDILWQNTVDGSFGIWIMNGSSYVGYGFGSQGDQWSIAGVADLDHTGFADILWRNVVTGELVGWKSGSGLNFTSFYIGSAGLDWNLSGAADLFGSGQSALIWRNQNSGEVVAWQLSNNAVSAQSSLGFVPLDWSIAGFGDFNGDGRTDILWHNSSDGSAIAWLMNGFSISATWINRIPISQDWQIRATPNVTGDSFNSILWSNVQTGEQVIWIPTGSGFSQSSIGFGPPPWTVLQ